MAYALVNHNNNNRNSNNCFTGFSTYEVVQNTNLFEFDLSNGCLYWNKEKDTISYDKSLTDHEMQKMMADRAITLLTRNGWMLYKGVK